MVEDQNSTATSPPENYFTTTQLAKKLNYGTAWISELCKRGAIKAHKPLGSFWRIPPEEYNRIVREGLPAPTKSFEQKSKVSNVHEIEIDPEKYERITTAPPEVKITPEEQQKGKRHKYWPLPFDLT